MRANGALRKVTSVDVARLAGVNQSTVSRAFKDDRTISAETRDKVMVAARELGYTPNAIARSLITRRTNIVGMVMSNISSPFQPYVLEKFIHAMQAVGLQTLVFTAGPGQDVDDILPLALQYQVDALVITTAALSSARIEECARVGTPVILFNRYLLGANVSAICGDNLYGAGLAADHLLAAGCRRLAYLAGDINSSTNRDRERGFSVRLRERGAAEPLREQAAYTYEAGYEAAGRLLGRDEPPDGVFCPSDIIALGVIDRARELGFAVPQDLCVVGFDDIPMASWSSYSLTTIRQPVDAMIEETRALLQDFLASPAMEPVVRLFPGILVERGSTRSVAPMREEIGVTAV